MGEAKMDPAIKAKWVERLRSGSVVQTQGHLGSTSGERCCLGVLCDIAVEEHIIDPPTEQETGTLIYDHWTAALPESVRAWIGDVADEGGDIAVRVRLDDAPSVLAGKATLIELNDDRDFTFVQIADVIEREL